LDEVDAPNLAFTVKQAGSFLLDVDETGPIRSRHRNSREGEVPAAGKTNEVRPVSVA